MILDEKIYLEHYGVKGMRWGVRRTQKELARNRPTKEERKSARKNIKKLAFTDSGSALERRLESMAGKRGLSSIPYSELSNRGRTIQAGKNFYRVSEASKETARDITFVSTNKQDHTRYKSVLTKHTFRSGFKDIKPTYEHVYQTTKKLTLPSEKARIDAFAELMDTKAVPVTVLGLTGPKTKMLSGREVLKKSGYSRDVRKLENTALAQKYFNEMQSLAWKNQGLGKAYFNNLRDKGFNAVVDDNDRGILSKDPIILLNPNGTVKSMKVNRLTAKDVNKAMQDFRPLDK